MERWLRGRLEPYPYEVHEDTKTAKASRVVEGVYQVTRRIPGLDGTVSLIVEGGHFAQQYAHFGLAGLIYHKELMEIIQVCCRANVNT